MDELSLTLGLSTERISIWFQNRRARHKKARKCNATAIAGGLMDPVLVAASQLIDTPTSSSSSSSSSASSSPYYTFTGNHLQHRHLHPQHNQFQSAFTATEFHSPSSGIETPHQNAFNSHLYNATAQQSATTTVYDPSAYYLSNAYNHNYHNHHHLHHQLSLQQQQQQQQQHQY